ncbi:MAG: ADOP family duplicated permease [Bryobacteraceae bacterium]
MKGPARIYRFLLKSCPELYRDLAHASRVYRRRAVSSALALAALALAIGATTGVFSVLNARLLRTLPFRDPGQIVALRDFDRCCDRAQVEAWRAGAAYLTGAALYTTEEMTLGAGAEGPARIQVAQTSANFFSLLGTVLPVGRGFAAGEDVEGRDGEAVLSYGLWQQAFGGDPRILGSTIRLNGVPVTVAGVAPAGMDFPGKAAAWTPTMFDFRRLTRNRAIAINAIGRLRPGLTLAEANRRYRADISSGADFPITAEYLRELRLEPLSETLSGGIRKASLALFGVVVFVLLTACANVAHLLLSRIGERQEEMAIRSALGASRARLVRQLVTESTGLTLAAAAAGLLVANWTARLAASVLPPALATQSYTVLDAPVLAFAAGVALATGLVFGVLPAGLLGRAQSLGSLQSIGDTGLRRLRGTLIALQAAFSLVLVSGAITLGMSFLNLLGTDMGFRTDHLVTANVALAGTPRENASRAYCREVLGRLRAQPGVESAAAAEFLPLGGSSIAEFFFTPESGGPDRTGMIVSVTADYLRTMRTPIVDGRDFAEQDERQESPVAIVNEAFARELDPGMRVVGQRITPKYFKVGALTVVGVARTERYLGPGDAGLPAVFFLPRGRPNFHMTFVARVTGRPEAALPMLRDTIRAVEPKAPVFSVETFDQRLRDSLARPRFYATAVIFFGAFALLLAVIGVYGVASFAIAQRRTEIGVRLAIGAPPARVRAMLLREGLLPVATGTIAGIAASAALARVAASLIEGAEPIGSAACAGAGALLLISAALAVWIATRRILRLDPVLALRAP